MVKHGGDALLFLLQWELIFSFHLIQLVNVLQQQAMLLSFYLE